MNALYALLTTLMLAAPGRPPSADEQRLFEDGMRAYQGGDARAADQAWRAGYALGKDPAFLVRMGEAEEKAGQPAEAGESYRRYLRAAPDAADRVEIEQRLARLGPAGAPPVAPDLARDNIHEVPGVLGAAEAPAPPAAATRPGARDDEIGGHLHGVGPGAGDDEPSGWNSFNITAWIATGSTVLLLGTSAYLAASAGSNKDDVNLLLRYQDPVTGAPLEYQTVAARYESATRNGQRDDRLAKDVLLAAAGTAVVATVFFVLDAVRTPEAPLAARRPAHDPALGLSLLPAGGGGGGVRTTAVSSLRWSF